MLRGAKERKVRFLFVSMVSVGGMRLAEEGCGEAAFRESNLYIGQDLGNIYLRSKFEAERLVLDAGRFEGGLKHSGEISSSAEKESISDKNEMSTGFRLSDNVKIK